MNLGFKTWKIGCLDVLFSRDLKQVARPTWLIEALKLKIIENDLPDLWAYYMHVVSVFQTFADIKCWEEWKT